MRESSPVCARVAAVRTNATVVQRLHVVGFAGEGGIVRGNRLFHPAQPLQCHATVCLQRKVMLRRHCVRWEGVAVAAGRRALPAMAHGPCSNAVDHASSALA